MEGVAKLILEFIIVFLIVYIFSRLFVYRKIKKYNRKKAPVNINYLIIKYKIDVVKIGYKKVSSILMLCDSFIVAIIYCLTKLADNLYIRLIAAFILIFPVFAGVYHIAALILKKESE